MYIQTDKMPKIVFQQWQLQIAIGQWLHMDASQPLTEIEKKFSYVLKLAGIEENEICVLKEFDKEKFSFNCYLKNTNINTNIELKWGDINIPKELTINYPQKAITYQYYQEEEKPILKQHHYTIKNSQNKNKCSRFISPHNIVLTVQNEEYTLSLKIENTKENNSSVFSLKKEAELQIYLLGLSFPLEINTIYKKICEITIDFINKYPKFELQIENNVTKETTDIISLIYGNLKKFMITKNGKTITISETGEIIHKTSMYTIKEKENGEINYSLNIKPGKKLPEEISPLKQYNEAQKEIAKAKEFIKTIIKSNNI